jgi:hypothetical protein
MSRGTRRRLAIASGNRSVPVGHCSALPPARSRRLVRLGVLQPGRGDGDPASHHSATLTLAERIRRARHRFDSPRVSGSHRDLQRAPSAPRPLVVRPLLPSNAHSSFARQGLPRRAPDHATRIRKGCRHPKSRWPASPLRTPSCLIHGRPLLANSYLQLERRRPRTSHRRLLDLEPGSVVRFLGPARSHFTPSLQFSNSRSCSNSGSNGIFSRDRCRRFRRTRGMRVR